MNPPDRCQSMSDIQQRQQKAIQALENVLSTPPRERHQIVDFGECAIVRLRDCLIEQYRQEKDPGQKEHLHALLDQANLALSLVTGVEYPGAGLQEKPLLIAMDVLKRVTP